MDSNFAAAHGLIIRHVEYGAWRRVPTTGSSGKRNGAYRHLGEVAFVQNHATISEVSVWHPDDDRDIRIDSVGDRSTRSRGGRGTETCAACSVGEGAVDHQGVPAEHSSLPGGKGIPPDVADLSPMAEC